MSDVKVSSVKPSEVSKEMVALYLLGAVAEAEGATVQYYAGVPVVTAGMTKKKILQHYWDCLITVKSGNGTREYLSKLPD